ncbi:hypothetical protein [Amycolatopsis sp. NBC_01480]|uniref:hypothetical protein n=1 Tax=Amycolatopsis sp. NBC_01480 TaxID=2903562 RepID=UPI002E2B08FD|nr:hypothetical protein [Amycolatopsis sp. NBC_01480]
MNPLDWLKLLGQLGDSAGEAAKQGLTVATQSVFDSIMLGIWTGALFVLRNVLEFIDWMSVFTVSTTDGPVSVLWPLMVWISGALAMGLFFWQLIVTVLRGGRGFVRLISGPIQYGVALSVTVGIVAAFLAAADGVTTAVLQYGLHSDKFADALHGLNFPDGVSDTIKAIVLGLFGITGAFPAAFGLGFEMVLRQASIYVVVATVPLLAAGLLAGATAGWFWKGSRIILALVFTKPGIALVIVIGVAVEGGAQGFFGLLSGVMILLISLWTPFVLFKLFAFVDPRTEAGGALRDSLADVGAHGYGSDSVPGEVGGNALDSVKDRIKKKLTGGGEDGDDDAGANDDQEQANLDRFSDDAPDDDTDIPDDFGEPEPAAPEPDDAPGQDPAAEDPAGPAAGEDPPDDTPPLPEPPDDDTRPPSADPGPGPGSPPGPEGDDDSGPAVETAVVP